MSKRKKKGNFLFFLIWKTALYLNRVCQNSKDW